MVKKLIAVAATSAALIMGTVGTVTAHDDGSAGEPVCLEANFMMADAMNSTPNNPPFASNQGPGRVLEMNIFTGTRGITVNTRLTRTLPVRQFVLMELLARVRGSQRVFYPVA